MSIRPRKSVFVRVALVVCVFFVWLYVGVFSGTLLWVLYTQYIPYGAGKFFTQMIASLIDFPPYFFIIGVLLISMPVAALVFAQALVRRERWTIPVYALLSSALLSAAMSSTYVHASFVGQGMTLKTFELPLVFAGFLFLVFCALLRLHTTFHGELWLLRKQCAISILLIPYVVFFFFMWNAYANT